MMSYVRYFVTTEHITPDDGMKLMNRALEEIIVLWQSSLMTINA